MKLPNKKYNIIYADPPWKYKTYSDRNVCPYPIMKDDEIYDLPIQSICEKIVFYLCGLLFLNY